MLLTGSQIVAECLIEQGVDTVFGYPGGTILNIYDALYQYQDKIHHILTSHEQGGPMLLTAMRAQQERLECVWRLLGRELRIWLQGLLRLTWIQRH